MEFLFKQNLSFNRDGQDVQDKPRSPKPWSLILSILAIPVNLAFGGKRVY
jgi:hypothetical protein